MANPRQRRKRSSHTYKPVSIRHAKRNLKKMPAIRGPKVLQQAWDNSKTVKQNYASLGLAHGLNPVPSGGVEFHEVQHMETSENFKSPVGGRGDHAPSIPKGHGKIIRDEDGNVIGVEFAQGEEPTQAANESTTHSQDMESLEPQIPSSILTKWAGHLGGGPASMASRDVVKALEMLSSMPSDASKPTISASITGVGARHPSTGEKMYLQRLVDKHGVNNIADMSRDRKLNSEQRTEGELRRALRRGGFA